VTPSPDPSLEEIKTKRGKEKRRKKGRKSHVRLKCLYIPNK
jgi:hypothetical protein